MPDEARISANPASRRISWQSSSAYGRATVLRPWAWHITFITRIHNSTGLPQYFRRCCRTCGAVNLNGMKSDGPMILPLGEGNRERQMIALMHSSGYRGPVGLLHHQRTMDAAAGLTKNIEGLRQILVAIGDTAGASTY
jgi:hypothetical protein